MNAWSDKAAPSSRSVRATTVLLIIGLAAAIALVGIRLQARLQPVPAEPPRPLAVETQILAPAPFVLSVQATGTVQAERRIALSAQLAARVVEVAYREGSRVEQGEVVVRLDEAEQRREVARLEAAVDRVEADLAFWGEQLQADRRLLESRTISRRALDETQRRVASLEASLRETREAVESARIRLDYAVIRAPFDGYVQTVHVLPGEFVQPGKPMLEVLAADPLKAVVPVAEVDLPSLREAQPALLRVPALAEAWLAQVNRVYPGLETGTRSATVELFLPSGLSQVRPGMAVAAEIELGRHDQALTVQRHVLRKRQGETGVYVVEEGVARWRTVEAGVSQHNRVLIRSGLHAGDEVIATPHPQLVEGRAVVVRNDWRGN